MAFLFFIIKMSDFKQKHSFERRQQESSRLREKYPGRIPILLNKCNKDDPDVDKYKYLIEQNTSMGQFIMIVRNKATPKLREEDALYFQAEVPGKSGGYKYEILNGQLLMSIIYDKYKNEDGFVYITYTKESTYGYGHKY